MPLQITLPDIFPLLRQLILSFLGCYEDDITSDLMYLKRTNTFAQNYDWVWVEFLCQVLWTDAAQKFWACIICSGRTNVLKYRVKNEINKINLFIFLSKYTKCFSFALRIQLFYDNYTTLLWTRCYQCVTPSLQTFLRLPRFLKFQMLLYINVLRSSSLLLDWCSIYPLGFTIIYCFSRKMHVSWEGWLSVKHFILDVSTIQSNLLSVV